MTHRTLRAHRATDDHSQSSRAEPNSFACQETDAAWDEYAKAVLYNGLGHHRAARAAADRACERDDFELIEGALAELVEAAIRSGERDAAQRALERLEMHAEAKHSAWTAGLASYARAIVLDDERSEDSYVAAIGWLRGTCARLALGRVHLLYGEWLGRRGRGGDARQHLTVAHQTFHEARLNGFAQRASRELLAAGRNAHQHAGGMRRRLTAQEAEIARLAARHYTNPQIGERLFLSPRTVEWHLSKIFTALGVSSRKELNTVLPRLAT